MSQSKRIEHPWEITVSQEDLARVQIKLGEILLELPVGLAEALARSLLERCPRAKE